MYHFIGTRRDAADRIVGYRVINIGVDGRGGRAWELTKDTLLNALREGLVRNLELVNGKIRTIGDRDRYQIVRKRPSGEYVAQSCTIIMQKVMKDGEAVGFTVYDTQNGIGRVSNEDAIAFGKYANAKVVDGKYVASLKGEFEKLELVSENETYRRMTDNDSIVNFDDVVSYLASFGVKVERRGNIEYIKVPDTGVKIEKLKFPSMMRYEFKFTGGPVEIGKLHLYMGEGDLDFGDAVTKIHEVIFDSVKYGAGGVVIQGNVWINKMYSTDRVTEISSVKLDVEQVNIVKISKSVKTLNKFIYGTDYGRPRRIKAIDLSEMESSQIQDSFSFFKSDVHVKLGGATVYYECFHAEEANIYVHGEFSEDTSVINGFDRVDGVEVLDLSNMKKLRKVVSLDGKGIRKVIMPRTEQRLEILHAFNKADIEELDCNQFSGAINLFMSFDKVDRLIIGSNARYFSVVYSVYSGTADKKVKIVIKHKSDEAEIPRVVGKKADLVVGEGIKKLDISEMDSCYESVRFPKSLERLVRRDSDQRGNTNRKFSVPVMNIEDTRMTVLEADVFWGFSYPGEVFEVPENIDTLEYQSLYFNEKTRYYIPETVKSMVPGSINASVVYLHKGSSADKALKSKANKVYVKSKEELAELRTSELSDKEMAKIKMVMADGEYDRWKNEDGYSENLLSWVKLFNEASRDVDHYKKKIEVNREKFVDFPITGFGDFGERIKKELLRECDGKVKKRDGKTTDQFALMSNLFTANMPFYAGAFTKKLLENEMADIEKRLHIQYEDGEDFIVSFPLKSSSIYEYSSAVGLLIIENWNVRFASVIDNTNYIKWLRCYLTDKHDSIKEGVLGRVVPGDIVYGDMIRMSTVGLMSVPEEVGGLSFEMQIDRYRFIDLVNGRLIICKAVGGKGNRNLVVKEIKEYGEYKLEGILQDFGSEDVIRMYEVIHGKPYESKTYKAEMHPLVKNIIMCQSGKMNENEFIEFLIKEYGVGKGRVFGNNVAQGIDLGDFYIADFGDTEEKDYFAVVRKNEVKYGYLNNCVKVKAPIKQLWEAGKSGEISGNKRYELDEYVGEYRYMPFNSMDRPGGSAVELLFAEGYSKVVLAYEGHYIGEIEDPKGLDEYSGSLMKSERKTGVYSNKVSRLFHMVTTDYENGQYIAKTAEKIRDGLELNREEQVIAAKLAYGFGGVFNYMGFKK